MGHKRIICLWMVLALLSGLWGCGGDNGAHIEEQGTTGGYDSLEDLSADQVPAASGSKDATGKKGTKPGVTYKAPEFADSAFHEDQAQGEENAKIDISCVNQGYVAVSAKSDKRLKFQVIKGDITYNYNIDSKGTPSIFPIQSGDGDYQFKVMENITDKKYSKMYAVECTVKLEDEFQPFLRPSDYVNYSETSACVKKAQELSKDASDVLEVVGGVFEYVCDTVKYDKKKAQTVQTGYLPDPDETMKTGKGICFDYAALAAAMLRSQGIPTKMVFGNVSPDDLYHAWNMFYTEETGWVTVKYEAKGGDWNRLDLTFSANGTELNFIGDGSNYSDTYYY